MEMAVMPEKGDQSIKEIVGSIRRVVRAIFLDSKKMVKEYGVTGPQSIVLKSLFVQGPLSATELARVFYVTPSNMTGVIDRLEQKGLVERKRSTDDRRVSHIALTQQGQQIAGSLPNPIEDKLIKGLSGLSEEDVSRICDAFLKVVDLVDAAKVDAHPLGADPRLWENV